MTVRRRACQVRRVGTEGFAVSGVCERCGCSLCAELNGMQPPLHTLLGVSAPASRVLVESDNWVVVPTLGSLVPGHIMLVPRGHFYSALACPDPLLRECDAMVDRCATRLRDLYGQQVVMFEHGTEPGTPDRCGACIEHAHLHLLPGPRRFVRSVTSKGHGWISARTLLDLRSELRGSAYLLAGEVLPGRAIFARRPDAEVPSQLLRRVFAAEVGNTKTWDWRKFPCAETLLQTMRDWTAGTMDSPNFNTVVS
jgi:diadenosine tetraphosphate (Ap4A) HIT family hydrolase